MATDSKTNGTEDFTRFANEAYKQWEKTMSSWWDQVLDSPAFLGAMGENLSTFAKAREQYESTVDDQLRRLHMPTSGDLNRVARIATLLEKRLLEIEDRVLEIQDTLDGRLASLEKEVLQARIEATEARLELRDQLVTLNERLARLEQPAPREAAAPQASTPKASTPRASTRKGPTKKVAD